jgi:choline dehydrogenase-like flavoprotein
MPAPAGSCGNADTRDSSSVGRLTGPGAAGVDANAPVRTGPHPICDLIEAELTPGPIANEQAAIEEDIRARAATFFHPSGTCHMGSDQTAVVDPRLRVIGLQGLRVADASIMPAALNACTHAPTIMIGEKGAAMIAEDS